MSDISFLGLVQNASLLLAAAFIFNVATTRWRAGQTLFQHVVVGLALGTIGITVMLTPMKFMPGIVFDTRSVLIGISGLFFGSFPTVIVMVITGAFRFYQGGAGTWTGIVVIFASGVTGIAWRYFRRRSLADISWRELYLLGMVVHLAMLAAMFTLPRETALRVLSSISMPVLVVYPIGTALLGTLMVNRLRRERAEETLVFTNIILRTQQESSIDGILVVDEKGKILSFNQRFVELWGIPPGVIESKSDERALQSVMNKLAEPQKFLENVNYLYEHRQETSRDEVFLKDGRSFDRYSTPMLGTDGNYYGRVWYFRDITERKQAEAVLKESESRLATIFENDPSGIILVNIKTRTVHDANKAAIEMLGLPKEDIVGKVCHNFICPAEVGSCPISDLGQEVDRSERVLILADGKRLTILKTVVPIKMSGEEYLLENFIDITERKLAEEKLGHAMEKLRKNLVGTIQVMSLMVETRDPYTAGHQKRVSNLARGIAQEMGLSSDTVDAIRMAGVIHDIGKLSVPAEILSKPTKLTDAEFSLIKIHPQSGYAILKDVELPYPIAEIVYQHHERLDGSGYPRGLNDGQIFIESCILAVADVVEAMASHRPYRPEKGIDAAIEEIEKNKGIFYDTKTVDACVRLFREKGFTFETTAS